MDHLEKISNLKARAAVIGYAFNSLCADAPVPRNTVRRWSQDIGSVHLGVFNEHYEKLHNKLREREREVLLALSKTMLKPDLQKAINREIETQDRAPA